jgi:hypothetical protein
MSERQKKREEETRTRSEAPRHSDSRERAESAYQNTARLFQASQAATQRVVRATDTDSFLENTQQLGGE